MTSLGGSNKILRILLAVSVIIIVIGSVFIYGLYFLPGVNNPQIIAKPHPIPPVSPASEIPGDEIEFIQVNDLRIKLTPSMYTYETHAGIRGTSIGIQVIINNNGTTLIEDLCFWKVTIYWIDGFANFTSGFIPNTNYTLLANSIYAMELEDAHDWTGIPTELCWGGSQVYGRILMSYDSNNSCILTTVRFDVLHAVE
ncbi:MAG: hypothetical protein MUP60_03465 [Candidatus Thorarchaeota archaeon]|nr:hypothetical protein [Candidatus Thorarchaeota archaeon]